MLQRSLLLSGVLLLKLDKHRRCPGHGIVNLSRLEINRPESMRSIVRVYINNAVHTAR